MPTRLRRAETYAFRFWTRGELARVSAIAGLALLPLLMSVSSGNDRSPDGASAHTAQRGYLRTVNVVTFDFGKLGMASLGDADDAAH